MEETERTTFGWLDLLWLVFLAGLAVLPPIFEIHKQFVLLSIGAFQIFEQRLLKPVPPRRRGAYGVLVKILLATLLVGHTGVVPINSSYYLIYYLPVVSAAMLFGPWATLFWTALASAAYCSFLLPALGEYELDRKSTRLNSNHGYISYAVFCLKKKNPGQELPCLHQLTISTEMRI